MKVKYLILSVILALTGFSTVMQAANDDAELKKKINDAVMQVYNDQLQKDPNDYNTLFARANQYYYNDDYIKALDDVTEALKITPEKEGDMQYDEYMLRAKIYDARENYSDELTDLKSALALNPTSLSCTDMLAKVSYKIGDLDASEQNYQVILRDNPMNYDALYGLAKVEAKRKNFDKAAEYADKAVKLFTAEPQVYINRADVLCMMEQYEPAAQDLISALSVGNDNGKALAALVDMSNSHYDAVMEALGNSIDKAPRVGMFYYVRSQIAVKHLHYGQALKDLNSIITNKLYDYSGIYYSAAQCQFELTKYDDALASVNKAIEMDAKQLDYYVLKAKIVLYQGKGNNYTSAMSALDQAATIDANDIPTMIEKAQVLIAQKKDKDAVKQLNLAIMSNPTQSEALLLRGWLYKYRIKDEKSARSDFEKILLNGAELSSLRGFALHELGRDDEAKQWIESVIKDNAVSGGEAYYYASALLSDIGDNTQAVSYLDNALANGYGSLFQVNVNEEPYVNLKLVRRSADFSGIVNKYTSNFEVK